MKRILRTSLLVGALAGLVCSSAMAQVDPFGDGAPAPEKKRSATKQRSAVPSSHPVAVSIREAGPKTPAHWLLAAQALGQVGAYDEARAYLKLILDSGADTKQLVGFNRRFGTAFFHELRTSESLQPEGAQLAKSVMDAVKNQWHDAGQVSAMLQQAAAEPKSTQLARVAELRAGGDLPVSLLVQWLRDPQRRADAQKLIPIWNPTANEPLGVALLAFWAMRLDSIELLPQTRIAETTPLLLAIAASDEESAERLIARGVVAKIIGRVPDRSEVEDHLATIFQQQLDEAQKIRRIEPMAEHTTWAWKSDLSQVATRTIWRDEWAILQAGRAAIALMRINPKDQERRRWLYLIDYQLRSGGNDPEYGIAIASAQTIRANLEAQPADELERLLEMSLKAELFGAAIHICGEMGKTGDRHLIQNTSTPTVLAATLQHPNRNVRFAGTMAVAQLHPNRAFPGATAFIESLRYFLTSRGDNRLLIAAGHLAEASEFAATAQVLGYSTTIVGSGNSMLKAIHDSSDISAILIRDSITQPPLREAVQQVRKSPLGKQAVILVMTRAERVAELKEHFRLDPRTVIQISIPEEASMAADMKRLLDQAGRFHTKPSDRLLQAKKALEISVDLLSSKKSASFIDAARFQGSVMEAIRVRELSALAAKVLSQLGTDTAQRTLMEVSLDTAVADGARKAAVVGLSDHLDEYGRLLSSADMAQMKRILRLRGDDDQIAALVSTLLNPDPKPAEAAEPIDK